MASTYVRALGDVEDIDGAKLTVGVDYDTVNIDGRRLSIGALEEFAQLIIAATWAAGVHQAMAAEVEA